MEVHHPHVEKKSFKEYLLEGLMIFIAVSMGFIAENIRENISDSAKEKEYMISLVNDLKNDIISIKTNLTIKRQGIEKADSVLSILLQKDFQNKTGEIYYFGRLLSIRSFYYPNDGTIQQLKNAGGFRYIKKRNVIDSLQRYISRTGNLLALQELEESNLNDYRKTLNNLFDAQIFNQMYDTTKVGLNIMRLNYNPPLISNNKLDINEFNMKVVYIKGVRFAEMGMFVVLSDMAAAKLDPAAMKTILVAG